MIILVTTGSHQYTHRYVSGRMPQFRLMSYPELFARRALKQATYIFSDFDRLSFWQLELAAHLFNQIKAEGWTVLNDPARVLHRLELLKRLKTAGLNSFSAWSGSELDEVDRFPVFIRTQAAHRGNLTDTLASKEELETAFDGLVREGYPVRDLMIAEYCAEPMREQVFRKLSVYKIADRLIATPSVYEGHWSAKYGELGAAGAEGYTQDLEDVSSNTFCAALAPCFDMAGIDYGRADFGLVGGKPEVYEINTNPMVEPSSRHPFEDRVTAFKLSDTAYFEGLGAIDTPSSKTKLKVSLPPLLAKRRRRVRFWPGYQWMP